MLEFCGIALLAGGNRDEFDRLFSQLDEVGKRTRDAYSRVLVLSLEPFPAILERRLENAVAAVNCMQALADKLGVPEMDRNFSARATGAYFLLGRFDEAAQVYAPNGCPLRRSTRARGESANCITCPSLPSSAARLGRQAPNSRRWLSYRLP